MMASDKSVVLQRVSRYLRTPIGPHCEILKKQFVYIHRTQERVPGQPVRIIGTPVDLTAEIDGWLYFACGLLQRTLHLLSSKGYQVEYSDTRKIKLPKPSVSSLSGLRPGQPEVIQAIIDADNGIVDALTGFGKGVVIEKVIELYPKQKHLIITKSKSICSQLYKRLSAKFPSAGMWSSDLHKDGNPLIATSGSLGHLELEKYDVVQLDEVHELLTKTFLDHYPRLEKCKLISYSASPDQRMDNTALAMEAYFGVKICKVDYADGVDLGLVVPIEVWRVNWNCEPADVLSNYKLDVKRMRLGYWTNYARNNAIARVVYEEIPKRISEKDPQILVLVDKIEHALHLKKQLPDFDVVYGSMDNDAAQDFKRAGLLSGNPISRKEVEAIREEFTAGTKKRVIATGIWSTGVDFPNLSVIIRADGGASQIKDIQMPGRVCRIAEGKEKGILVDFGDFFDFWAARRAKSRFTSYKDKKWDILDVMLSS
jgi:superfamily II DNA or RNA helicase